MRLPNLRRFAPWLLLPAMALILSLSAACRQVDPPIAPPPSPGPPAATPTGVPPAPTLTAHAAATLTVAEIGAEIRSEFATADASNARAELTLIPLEQTALARPTPAHPIFPTPWPTSAPQPTPVVGPRAPQDCVYGVHDGFSQIDGTNCWIVRLENTYLYVFGGFLYNVRTGDLADTSMGAIAVAGGWNGRYPTPQQLGPVRIVAVDGARVTLQTYSALAAPVTFVFDLRTRQWVNPAPTPTPVTTATLTRPDMDATKIARYEQQRQEWEAMATRIANGTPFVYTPIAIPTTPPRPTRVLGLSTWCIDPDRYYTYWSCWVGRYNNEYLFVSSGSIKRDPIQGMMRVYTTTLDELTWGPEQTYLTPVKAGLVHITDAVGQRLTLRADTGTFFYFDLATRQWVNPAPSPTPSLTLWPTRHPPPHQDVENGTIYPAMADDPLCHPIGAVNVWEGRINHQPIAVCAGTRKYDPRQGAIQVQVETGGLEPDIALYYETPSQDGAVHIINATGTRLTLRSANNTIFVFDLLTRQWMKPPPELGF